MNTLKSATEKEFLSSSPATNGLVSWAFRIFKFFASLPLAMTLLISLIIIMTAGTLIESLHGADAARLLIYDAAWFSALLLLLGFNLVASALDRLPWKLKHVGFVMTHAGIILILIGSYMTQKMMIDGQMALAEGETDYRITLPSEPILYVHSQKQNQTWFFDLKRHAFAWQGREKIKQNHQGQNIPFSLHMLANYPKASREEYMAPSHIGNPAIQIRLKNSFVEEKIWLIKNDPHRGQTQMGPVTLRFAEQLLKENPAPPSKDPYLEFQFKESENTLQMPVKSAVLSGTPYKIKILRTFKNAVVEGKDLIEDPNPKAQANPAVEFLLEGPGFEERHTVFANFPDFPTVHGMKPSQAGIKVYYRLSNAGSRGELHEIRFVSGNVILRPRAEESKEEMLRFAQHDKKNLFIQIVEGMKITTHEAEKGKEIQTGWMGGLAVTIEEFYPAAVLKQTVKPEANTSENPKHQPAIQIEFHPHLVSSAQVSEEKGGRLWLTQGEPGEMQIAGDPYTFVYAQKRIPAGFKLKLKDFRLEEYPGTNQPASFESDVTLIDDSRGLVKDQTISMNKPLIYRGYRIYQSGYSLPQADADPSNQKEISIFAMGKDPGVPLKYLGAIIMVAGIITLYYTRRFSTTAGKSL